MQARSGRLRDVHECLAHSICDHEHFLVRCVVCAGILVHEVRVVKGLGQVVVLPSNELGAHVLQADGLLDHAQVVLFQLGVHLQDRLAKEAHARRPKRELGVRAPGCFDGS